MGGQREKGEDFARDASEVNGEHEKMDYLF